MADTKEPQNRDPETGRVIAGNSLNPGGRRRMPKEVRDMLDAATPKAAKTLVDALEAERAVVIGSGDAAYCEMVPDYDLRIKAANSVLDRMYGKPTQTIGGEDGGPAVVAVDLAAVLQRMVGKE